jgi:cellulose synthase operon protein C
MKPALLAWLTPVLLALGASAWAASATAARPAPPAACRTLQRQGHQSEAQRCFMTLTQQDSAYLRAEGDWGLKRYAQANREFRVAVAAAPGNADYRVRWGRLLHERFDDADARDLFQEALMRDPRSAPAFLGLALVSADGFDNHALEWAHKALELDPQSSEAHELLATLALEDSDSAQAAQQADAALALSADELDALAIHAAIELLSDRPAEAWLDKIRAINPHYGDAYALIAHHLVLRGRYEDGIAYYRRAIEADPQLWSARSELAINLMRLGQESEPRRQLALCYQNGYRDFATVNTLRLLDSYQNFVTFQDATTILKLHKQEAQLLHPYFEAELKRDLAAYELKYRMKLPDAVQVEVYPDHEDFAVRTLGMPGLGALGVTFGEVVAMDSPSGRKPGEFHWAATLRHEMSHVFILTATNHRVPRWFTEGLAVHEQTVASSEWGDPMTPDILLALRDKKLLPVADLDRGFVRPEYPSQVLVSYFQAGRICDYIQSRWGEDKLLDLVHSFAHDPSTPQAISDNLNMTPEQFDQQFQAWLYQSVGDTPQRLDEWRTRMKNLAQLAHAQQPQALLKEAAALIALYPDYVYEGNAYQVLSQAQLDAGDAAAATGVLTQYEHIGGRDPVLLKQLAHIEEQLGDPTAAAATLDRINYIDPVYDEELHRHLGTLWLDLKNYTGAIREFGAVLAMHPLDAASAQFDLARAYLASGQPEAAETHVLAALEAAPDYKPAQKLLLQLESNHPEK